MADCLHGLAEGTCALCSKDPETIQKVRTFQEFGGGHSTSLSLRTGGWATDKTDVVLLELGVRQEDEIWECPCGCADIFDSVEANRKHLAVMWGVASYADNPADAVRQRQERLMDSRSRHWGDCFGGCGHGE